jgi:GT2 family glycosyltransferase|tara:strand:- start:2462 stop:3385 length:924 start_codon:yes stop_codon:yes gene_type:complete
MIVHVVIVTYNGMNWLKNCLDSVLNSSIPLKVVVVDNNSSDSTVSFIKNNYSEIVLVAQTTNLGFGAANNLGISYALNNSSDFIFLLNQDTFLYPETIERLIEVSLKNKEFGVISPIHLNGLGNDFDLNFLNYMQKNTKILFEAFKNNFSKSIYEVPFVNAAAWLLPRKTIETVGGFDPLFFHYGEDDNYCQRILFHKFKVGVVPGTYINHDRECSQEKRLLSSSEKLSLRERYLKTSWANINLEVDMLNKPKSLKKLIFKLILKLKLKKANYYIKEYQLMKGIIPRILKSREINTKVNTHYLSIDE